MQDLGVSGAVEKLPAEIYCDVTLINRMSERTKRPSLAKFTNYLRQVGTLLHCGTVAAACMHAQRVQVGAVRNNNFFPVQNIGSVSLEMQF